MTARVILNTPFTRRFAASAVSLQRHFRGTARLCRWLACSLVAGLLILWALNHYLHHQWLVRWIVGYVCVFLWIALVSLRSQLRCPDCAKQFSWWRAALTGEFLATACCDCGLDFTQPSGNHIRS
ncbi:MAG TPA: hypothetical protein VMG33_14675 [Steroidobacteraceae bacterium]|nr:hypothetical protein [Steroidobacteraceae bacterium]